MKKYIEDEIFRGILIALLGIDGLLIISQIDRISGIGVWLGSLGISRCVIVGLGLFALILRSAGHYRGKEEIQPNYFDRYPLEIYMLGDGMIVLCCCGLFAWLNNSFLWPLSLAFLGIAYLGAVFGCMSVAVRCKTHTLFTNTLVYKSCAAVAGFFGGIWNSIKFYFTNLPLYPKTAATIALLTLVRFMWPVGPIISGVIAMMIFGSMHMAWSKIGEGIEKIAGGDTDYKVDTFRMPKEIAHHAENLNNINVIVADAVKEQMKGERLKTELITNVSHDIKNPLTSIINYIDLIKKENITQRPLADYVNVLQRQSDRLKKLIDDLVEASKASTGNIAVHLSTTGINLLLNQAAGEYMDKAESRGLEISLNLPEEEMYVLSDGRLLWRIFDNLLNNACKYSRPGTRVYIDARQSGNKVVITFKNISRSQLNISPDELMERFVRGDSSRNTEGSGLGLSIAQSLTEILNGRMSLDIDGDMFKAVLTFDTV